MRKPRGMQQKTIIYISDRPKKCRRHRSQRISESFRHRFTEVYTRRIWPQRDRSLVEGSASYRRQCWWDSVANTHGKTGFLVNSIEDAAQKTSWLLKHPAEAKKMGKQGREHILKNFLITRHLKDYLKLFSSLSEDSVS
jgi:hypothetical protein